MSRTFGIIFSLGLTLSLATPAIADEVSIEDRAKIESMVRSYLLENPEVLIEAINVCQQRQAETEAAAAARAIEEFMPDLAFDDNSPVSGNPDGDVTVVEFFDYRCSYCKRVGPDVQALMDDDPGIRFVYKEWPIL